MEKKQTEEIILPYIEAMKITHVAQTLECGINPIMEWVKRGLFDLYIDASSLYGQLTISCKKNAPVINNYINMSNEVNKENPIYTAKSIADFTYLDLLQIIPRYNRPNSLARAKAKKFIKDESDDTYFKISIVLKGEGFWRVSDYDLKNHNIKTINNQEFFMLRHLELNYKSYDAVQNLPKNYAKGLNARFSLLDNVLVCSDDFYIHNHDFKAIIENKFNSFKNNEFGMEEQSTVVGKPSNFYKPFAIETALLTRKKFPYCKVSYLARKIHLKIINDFNASSPPQECVIANWLYEIKIGKPSIASKDDFELVIPDKWVDYSE